MGQRRRWVKWWPKSTHFDVTTKSRPLFSRSAGVARHGSRPKTLSAMKREKPISHQVEQTAATSSHAALIVSPRESDEAQGASPLATATASQTMADTREGTVVFGRELASQPLRR